MKFRIYRDKRREFRWTLYRKGRKVADSAEGYKRIGKCRREIEQIMLNVHEAAIDEL